MPWAACPWQGQPDPALPLEAASCPGSGSGPTWSHPRCRTRVTGTSLLVEMGTDPCLPEGWGLSGSTCQAVLRWPVLSDRAIGGAPTTTASRKSLLSVSESKVRIWGYFWVHLRMSFAL